MNLASYVLGLHAFWFRDGDTYTVPSAGTAGRSFKPGATDPKWIDFGAITDADADLDETEIEIWAPTPGVQRLWDIIATKPKLKLQFTTEEFGPFHLETLLRTERLDTASTQFNPLEGALNQATPAVRQYTKRGWLKLQDYSQADPATPTIALDAFVRLKISGGIKIGGGELVKPQFEAMVLHSTLNTGTLGTS